MWHLCPRATEAAAPAPMPTRPWGFQSSKEPAPATNSVSTYPRIQTQLQALSKRGLKLSAQVPRITPGPRGGLEQA